MHIERTHAALHLPGVKAVATVACIARVALFITIIVLVVVAIGISVIVIPVLLGIMTGKGAFIGIIFRPLLLTGSLTIRGIL